jgi:hypothetical protein
MEHNIARLMELPPRLEQADIVRRAPAAWLQARPVWDRAEVERWAEEHDLSA